LVIAGWGEHYGHKEGSEQRTGINAERKIPNSQWTEYFF